MSGLKLAMDKSMRTVDRFGRMYIKVSNISKAVVNPYRGSEIPQCDALGLDPDRIYMLLRDPEELRKAADTFNNIPLLDRHIPVTAEAPSQQFVVGSTGTDARFDEPYLRNSLVVWTATAIAGINTNQQRELSSAYSYDADMTPGVYEGKPYDGIMRNIKGNHVALVEVGRAGPDVVVGDSKLSDKTETMKKKLSTNARIVAAALAGALRPVLAQDAQIGDLTAIVGGVKSLKPAKEQQRIVTAITKEYGEKLAQDATLDHVAPLLLQLAQDEEDDAPVKPPKVAAGEDEEDDDEDDEGGKKKEPVAMDAASVNALVVKTQQETVARMQAIHQAERDVEPFVGRLAVAMDSAESVYKVALDAAKVDLVDVHPSAYKAMVRMLPKPGSESKPVQTRINLAQDAAVGASAFDSVFTGASKMKGGA